MLHLLAFAIALPALADAARRTGARSLAPIDRWLWAGLTVGLLALKSMTVELSGTPALVYQGAAFLAIVLGYCRALVSLALVLALTLPLADWGPAMLVDALLPLWCTCTLVGLLRRHGPPNPFLFLIGAGFFAPFAVGAVQLLAGRALAALGPDAPASAMVPAGEAFAYALLLLGGEATLEGMLITVLAVHLPRSVALFDDAHYLSAGREM